MKGRYSRGRPGLPPRQKAAVAAGAPGGPAPPLTGCRSPSQQQSCNTECGWGPERKHPPDQFGLHLRQPLLELGVERGPPRAPLRVQLRQPLFELGIEPAEVELVQLAQVG